MTLQRRTFLKSVFAASGAYAATRTIPVALVQFDAVPGQVDRNTAEVERLTKKAVSSGARWVMFHEATLCDYNDKPADVAQPIPEGKSVRRLEQLARTLGCFLSYGLVESAAGSYHITQVFTGPHGFIYRYRKTWIWYDRTDTNFRDEWVRYDPGSGPELFAFDGLKATCFICSDGNSQRCLRRARDLKPDVVFHPNNRGVLEETGVYDKRARAVAAPLLVTNRVGMSWTKKTTGGSAIYSSTGEILARANREGREEILRYDLRIG